MNDASAAWGWEQQVVDAVEADRVATANRERAEAYGRYIAPAGAPKISGLPTNHYDPSTAALPYQQGAFNYNNHWGTPEWYGGQIIGYSFVQHDIQPGYKSYFRTDLEGNVVHHEISPEGEDLTFKDILTMAAPFVLSFIPGVGAAIGGALAPTVSTATQAVIGNALVQGTLAEATGGDFIKGALTSVASSSINTYAGDVGSSMGITDPTIAKVVGKTLLQGTFTAATGGDFIDGAITGALSGTGQKAGEFIGLEGAAASSVGTSVVNGVIASVKGTDVSDAMINGAISGLLGYKEPKGVAGIKSEQQTVPTQEEMQPSIDQLTEELAPYERPNITVPTQEEMQPSIDQLTEELATDEEVPELIVTASKEQTVPTQEEMQLSIDQLTEELIPYERPSINIPTDEEVPELIVTASKEQTVPTQEEMQPSIDQLTEELAPYERPSVNIPTIDEEPIDATEKEGSLAKETEPTQPPVDYNKLLNLAGALISGSLATRPSTTRPSTSITQPSVSTSTTPSSLTDEDIYKDAPIKGFSMRPTASGRYVPYIGEKAQLAKGGLVSKPKKSNSKGLAGRRK